MPGEFVRQFVFMAGILAGFSLGAVAQFAAIPPDRPFSAHSLSLMIVSSTLSLVSVTIGSVLLILLSAPVSGITAVAIGRLAMLILGLFLLALISFLAGLAFAGFMHSRRVGLIAAATSLIAFLLIILFGFVSIRNL
jgi:hypothetical protein